MTSGDGEIPGLKAGDVIGGKYLLLEPIATGGMGSLWKARNLATGAEVAAKFLLPRHAASADSILRFRREAQATATLSHRGIVRVFDLVEVDPERGSLVMILELLRGHSLGARIEQMGPLSEQEAIRTVLPVLSALSHAHGLGIVHRDLKPENIFLVIDPDGRQFPKLIDFGISKMLRGSPITLDGITVGTLSYMSPEQTMGALIDARADLFSVGVILYECLTGINPFETAIRGGIDAANLMAVFNVIPPRPVGISDALWTILCRSMSFRPEDRFESAAELADALRPLIKMTLERIALDSILPAAPHALDSTLPPPPPVERVLSRVAPLSRPSPTTAVELRVPHRTALSAIVVTLLLVAWGGIHLANARTEPPQGPTRVAEAHAKRVTHVVDRVDGFGSVGEPDAPADPGDASHPTPVYRRDEVLVRDPGF